MRKNGKIQIEIFSDNSLTIEEGRRAYDILKELGELGFACTSIIDTCKVSSIATMMYLAGDAIKLEAK